MYFQGFEAHGWVDLVDIYALDLSNSLDFHFRQTTLAHPRSNNTAGAPALGTGTFGILDNLCVFNVF